MKCQHESHSHLWSIVWCTHFCHTSNPIPIKYNWKHCVYSELCHWRAFDNERGIRNIDVSSPIRDWKDIIKYLLEMI